MQVESDGIAAQGKHGDKQTHTRLREQQTRRPTCHRQQSAFGQQLTNEAHSSGADREPQRDFLLPRIRSGQEQIGYIDASIQQSDPHHPRQDAQLSGEAIVVSGNSPEARPENDLLGAKLLLYSGRRL